MATIIAEVDHNTAIIAYLRPVLKKRAVIVLLSSAAAALFGSAAFIPHIRTNRAVLDKTEERKAYEYLNTIRENPASFSKSLHVNLRSVKPRPALRWNDTLAKVAETKALDMATRNYFNHITPEGYGMNYYINKAGYKLDAYMLADKKDNFFESIDAGADSGIGAIRDLVIDKGTPGLGHRIHLLSMNDFYADLTDVGIGFARTVTKKDDGHGNSDTYNTYMSVIIAKHHAE